MSRLAAQELASQPDSSPENCGEKRGVTRVLARWIAGHEKLAAALLLLVSLCITHRDVIFCGHTFLIINRAPGTLPKAALLPEYSGRIAQGYPGPLPIPGQDRRLDIGAIAWAIEPYQYYSRQVFRHGEVPLWNPHVGLGETHVGVGQSGVFDPLNLLVYFAPRRWYPLAYDVEFLLRLFLMGYFTFLFARRLSLPFWPAALAAVAMQHLSYGFSYGTHLPINVVATMPLVFYAFQLLLERTTARTVALAAVAVALPLLTDFAEMTFCVLQFAAAYYAFAALLKVIAADRRAREAGRLVGGMAAAVLLGFALGSPVLLPLVENAAHAESIHEAAGESGVSKYAYRPAEWREMLLPPRDGVPGPRPTSYYATMLLLAFTLPFGFRRCRRAKAAGLFFLVAALFFWTKTLGLPGTEWLGHLPIYRQIALWKYLPPLSEFGFAMAAAAMLSHLMDRNGGNRLMTAAALVLTAICAALLRASESAGAAPARLDRLLLLATIVGLCCAVVLLRETFRLRPWLLGAGILAVLVIEVNALDHKSSLPWRWHPFLPPPFVEFLRQQKTPCRICATEDILIPNIACAYGIDDIRFVTALNSLRRSIYRPLFSALPPKHFFCESLFLMGSHSFHFNKFFNAANTEYVVTVGGLPPEMMNHREDRPTWSNREPREGLPAAAAEEQFRLVYSKEVNIYRNNWAYPRAFVVYRGELAANTQDAAARLRRADFTPNRQAVLEGLPPRDCPTELLGPDSPPPAAAEVVARTTNTMRIKASCQRPGILVVSESYSPGWKAYVDGVEAPIYPADVAFRGILLGPGDHEIELRYRPLSFMIGVLAAGAAMLVLALALGKSLSAARRAAARSPEAPPGPTALARPRLLSNGNYALTFAAERATMPGDQMANQPRGQHGF